MIVWQRWGILVILTVPLALVIGLVLLAPALFGPDPTSSQTTLAMGIGLLLASAILWLVVFLVDGKVIDKPVQVPIQQQLQQPIVDERGREQSFVWVPAVDPATGQPVLRRPRSTLFFVPIRFWPYVFAAIGLLALVSGIVGLANGD